MSTAEKHKELYRRFTNELMNKGKYEVADEIFSRDYVEHDPFNPPDVGKGPAMVKEQSRFYRNAFPDLKMTIDEMISTEERITVRCTAEGTHKGALMDIKPTNKKVKVTGITISRIKDGKIAEAWSNWNAYGMMIQLGAQQPTPKPKKKVA